MSAIVIDITSIADAIRIVNERGLTLAKDTINPVYRVEGLTSLEHIHSYLSGKLKRLAGHDYGNDRPAWQ